ncbi:MAG: hypothetical protein ACI9ZT_002013 [Gammaproteobacteria bacterium]|jgi:hypothetical protein
MINEANLFMSEEIGFSRYLLCVFWIAIGMMLIYTNNERFIQLLQTGSIVKAYHFGTMSMSGTGALTMTIGAFVIGITSLILGFNDL